MSEPRIKPMNHDRDTLYFRVSLIWTAVVLSCLVFVLIHIPAQGPLRRQH
jgi:hypothetical protein